MKNTVKKISEVIKNDSMFKNISTSKINTEIEKELNNILNEIDDAILEEESFAANWDTDTLTDKITNILYYESDLLKDGATDRDGEELDISGIVTSKIETLIKGLK